MSGPWHREASDIRVQHPVHLLPENAGVKGVQRIVLAAPRPESVGEPEEVFLVDCFENRRDRLLDDFVLQAQNAQRSFRAVSLRNVGTSGWSGRMASPYPMGDFHLLFFASFPGALRFGSIASLP